MPASQKHGGITEQRRAQNRAAQRSFRNRKREREETQPDSSPELALTDTSTSPATLQEIVVASEFHPIFELSQVASANCDVMDAGPSLYNGSTSIDWPSETQALQLQDNWDDLGNPFRNDSSLRGLENLESTQVERAAKMSQNDVERCPPEYKQGPQSGKTALHLAAEYGHVKCAQALLLMFTADVNATDADGNTALHLSAYYGNLAVAQLLVRSNATLAITNKHGYSALHCAVERDSYTIVKLLLQHGIDIDKRVEVPV